MKMNLYTVYREWRVISSPMGVSLLLPEGLQQQTALNLNLSNSTKIYSLFHPLLYTHTHTHAVWSYKAGSNKKPQNWGYRESSRSAKPLSLWHQLLLSFACTLCEHTVSLLSAGIWYCAFNASQGRWVVTSATYACCCLKKNKKKTETDSNVRAV